ncbi:unnamed protein product [Closterium sp. NIES-53]
MIPGNIAAAIAPRASPLLTTAAVDNTGPTASGDAAGEGGTGRSGAGNGTGSGKSSHPNIMAYHMAHMISNLLQNPSFEAPTFPTQPPHWRAWGRVAHICPASSPPPASLAEAAEVAATTAPFHGTCALEIAGCDAGNAGKGGSGKRGCSWGGVSQRVPTRRGTRYRLTFFFAARAARQRSVNLRVRFGGERARFALPAAAGAAVARGAAPSPTAGGGGPALGFGHACAPAVADGEFLAGEGGDAESETSTSSSSRSSSSSGWVDSSGTDLALTACQHGVVITFASWQDNPEEQAAAAGTALKAPPREYVGVRVGSTMKSLVASNAAFVLPPPANPAAASSAATEPAAAAAAAGAGSSSSIRLVDGSSHNVWVEHCASSHTLSVSFTRPRATAHQCPLAFEAEQQREWERRQGRQVQHSRILTVQLDLCDALGGYDRWGGGGRGSRSGSGARLGQEVDEEPVFVGFTGSGRGVEYVVSKWSFRELGSPPVFDTAAASVPWTPDSSSSSSSALSPLLIAIIVVSSVAALVAVLAAFAHFRRHPLGTPALQPYWCCIRELLRINESSSVAALADVLATSALFRRHPLATPYSRSC